MARFVGAIDSGTTSTRFMLFDERGAIVDYDQREHRQIFPQSGWVEHDPLEIWERTRQVIGATLASVMPSPVSGTSWLALIRSKIGTSTAAVSALGKSEIGYRLACGRLR